VRSAERRHQSPEWTVLSQVNCVVLIYAKILFCQLVKHKSAIKKCKAISTSLTNRQMTTDA